MSLPSSQTRAEYTAVSDSLKRPYEDLPLNTILDLIDQAQDDMRTAGRCGDATGYLNAEARESALQDEWDRIEAERRR
jgi:hypothetical protein